MKSDISLKLKDSIKNDEGFRRFIYKDIKGNQTIGYGRNVAQVGVSELEAEILLSNDISNATMELYRFLPFAQSLDDIRKAALIELTFNVGIEKVIQFRKMIDALKNKDFELASNEMLDSEWAKEVGNRANKLSAWIKTGEMS